jgi:hypothetical protein
LEPAGQDRTVADVALAILLSLAAVATLWIGACRLRHARRGERLHLRERRRVLRRYRFLRDGRAYHPERNPEVARLLGDDAAPRR